MNELQNFSDYREILRRVLENRSQRNPTYSLRAFARDLRISPSRLSDILNGRYGLSLEASQQISRRLELPEWERSKFCDLVEARHARSEAKRKLAVLRLRKYEGVKFHKVQEDVFRVISDWYHFAILELFSLKSFSIDPEWIAEALQIHKKTVQSALERLLRLKLLRIEKGELTPTEDFSITGSDTPSAAIKDFHTQCLQKALLAIHSQTVDEREFGTVLLSIAKSDLPKAKDAIREFQTQFIKTFSGTTKKDAVYCLGNQFFNLTSNLKTKGETK